MRNVSHKSCRENQNTMFNSSPLPHTHTEDRAFYEIMLKNVVKPDRPQTTIQYVAEKIQLVSWITNARTQTHTFNY